MGIPGLLPKLRSITTPVNLSQYRYKTAGIDAFGWLHKGAYSCCVELAQGQETDAYIDFVMERIRLLQSYDISPILVLDGAPLPVKKEVNQARRSSRDSYRQQGLDLFQLSKDKDDEYAKKAINLLSRSTSITFEMQRKLIAALRQHNIEFMVAPYEADAQLAYLSKKRMIDFVISEDSDCLPYGCKSVVFKLGFDGFGEEIRRKNLGANEELCFIEWTEEMFLEMCVLAGCDYCPSIRGIGIVTAYRLVDQNKSPVALMKALRHQYREEVPENYEQDFYRALMTFQHQRVYDPKDNVLLPLNSLEHSSHLHDKVSSDPEFSFLGQRLPNRTARHVALGLIHPITHEVIEDDDRNRKRRRAQSPTLESISGESTTHSHSSQEQLKLHPSSQGSRKRPGHAIGARNRSSEHYETPNVSPSFHPLLPNVETQQYEENLELERFANIPVSKSRCHSSNPPQQLEKKIQVVSKAPLRPRSLGSPCDLKETHSLQWVEHETGFTEEMTSPPRIQDRRPRRYEPNWS